MYKILVPKALKPVAREFLTKKGYELVSPEATDEASLAKAIADVDAVIVPVGGGGLISGIAYTAKHIRPSVKVYGVQMTGAPSMYLSLIHI